LPNWALLRTIALRASSQSVIAAISSTQAAPAEPPRREPPRRSDRSRCRGLRPATAAPARPNFRAARGLVSSQELTALTSAARQAPPDRVTLRASGSFTVLCECPPFAIAIADVDGGSEFVIAIPPKGVPDILTERTALEFVLQGYFSGASIDTYEHFDAVGAPPGTPDEEQRSTWRDPYPEFCLEAWCFSIPSWSDEFADVRAVAAEDAARVRKLGVPQCPAGAGARSRSPAGR